jgi:two-component system, OmpR family, sensor histidine kinase VicK
LRTPAQAIIGYAELLNKSKVRDREYEKTLLRNAARLHRLSTKLLEVARIETKSLMLHKKRFDINDEIKNVIKDVTEAHSLALKNNNIIILFSPKEPIIVNADRARIGQVISNLLSNSIKFTDNGTITVIVEKDDSSKEVVVTVTDTGNGIPPNMLPLLFKRTAIKSETGMGLGLFISKNIVIALGGEIKGYNNVGMKGATFRFSLPFFK